MVPREMRRYLKMRSSWKEVKSVTDLVKSERVRDS